VGLTNTPEVNNKFKTCILRVWKAYIM